MTEENNSFEVPDWAAKYLPQPPQQNYTQSVLDLPKFQYSAIGSTAKASDIRVLEVLSHRTHGLLTCRLHHRPASTSYQALSYTWGKPLSPEESFRIYMIDNESSVEGAVLVRETLHDFLTCAAAQCEGETFWIDALCINQDDIAERNKEVARMGDIYNHAESVRIWGLDVEPDLFGVLKGHSGEWEGISADISILTDSLAHKIGRHDLLSAASSFFGSTYFTRLWIIQEVFQADKLQFYSGSEWLDWSVLELIHSAVKELHNTFPESPFHKLDRARKDFKATGKFPSLDIAIEFSWDSKCSNLHDKIYGVLSITSGMEDFGVDYHESCELLLVRILKQYSDMHISRLLDFAHKLVQLLELNYRKLYDYVYASNLGIDFEISANLCTMWAPTTSRQAEMPAGVVCPKCVSVIDFGENFPRLPPRIFLWCPNTGYDKKARPTHVVFRHMYREQGKVPPRASALHTIGSQISAFLGFLRAPFAPLQELLGRAAPVIFQQTSRNTTQPLPKPDTADDHSPAEGKWQYLRTIGWKMSDTTDNTYATHFFRLDPSDGSYAILRPRGDTMLYQGTYNASVIFSAAQMIRFIFFIERVPYDKDGWNSNYVDDPQASVYEMLNPETRVHLQHRDSRVRTRTSIADYVREQSPEVGVDKELRDIKDAQRKLEARMCIVEDRLYATDDVGARKDPQSSEQGQYKDWNVGVLGDEQIRRHSI